MWVSLTSINWSNQLLINKYVSTDDMIEACKVEELRYTVYQSFPISNTCLSRLCLCSVIAGNPLAVAPKAQSNVRDTAPKRSLNLSDYKKRKGLIWAISILYTNSPTLIWMGFSGEVYTIIMVQAVLVHQSQVTFWEC